MMNNHLHDIGKRYVMSIASPEGTVVEVANIFDKTYDIGLKRVNGKRTASGELLPILATCDAPTESGRLDGSARTFLKRYGSQPNLKEALARHASPDRKDSEEIHIGVIRLAIRHLRYEVYRRQVDEYLIANRREIKVVETAEVTGHVLEVVAA